MKNQTPTWAIIVAILMMLIGGCGIKNDIQSINIRSVLEMKDKILDNIQTKKSHSKKTKRDSSDNSTEKSKAAELDSSDLLNVGQVVLQDSLSNDSFSKDSLSDSDNEINVKDMFGSLLDVPEETISTIIRFGYIGLFFSFFFILGAVFLLIQKNFSIKLAYAVLGANILFSIFRWVMLSGKGGTLLALGNSIGAAFSIFSSIILVVVILSSDKSNYEDIYADDF